MSLQFLGSIITSIKPYFYTVGVVGLNVEIDGVGSRILTVCNAELACLLLQKCIGRTIAQIRDIIEELGLTFLAHLEV